MKISVISRPRMQFTRDHEWIDFNGTVGFVGASIFKLKGIEKVDSIKWHNRKGTIEKGTLIAEIRSDHNVIPIHAPVKCKFLGQNQKLNDNLNLILESPQDNGWMFFITPSKFLNHDPLLSMEEYQQFIRTNEACSAQ